MNPHPSEDEELDPDLDFDLDAEIALQAEAKKKPIKVRIAGRVVPFPQMSDWPWEAVEALQTGALTESIEILFPVDSEEIQTRSLAKLTSEQIESVRRSNEETVDFFRSVPVQAVRRLFEHFSAKSGVSPGELRRSERRSRSTRRR